MKTSKKPQEVFFVGIKGVGMTALALIYQDMGFYVCGSDTKDSQITDEVLKNRGIKVYSFGNTVIDTNISKVIYSGAYKLTQNPDLIKAKDLNIPIVSQATALSQIVNSKKSICVCGVGGKTTTTSMLATVLDAFDLGSWFAGVSQINSQIEPGKWRNDDLMIVEADEYAIDANDNRDPKFSLYNPKVVICTNLAFDHPDIYSNFDQTLDVFGEFFNKIPTDGCLIIRPSDLEKIQSRLKNELKVITFGFENNSDWRIETGPDLNTYNIFNQTFESHLEMSVIGNMNAANALSGAIALNNFNLPISKILAKLKLYKGAKRRLELIKSENECLFFDDYGHHPDEIRVTLESLKSAYPNKKLRVIFHPHTFSRTKALFDDFAKELAIADELILAPIFGSAREMTDSSISHIQLAQKISQISSVKVNYFKNFDQIIEYVKSTLEKNQIILTLGAGDIYKIHNKL